MKKYILLLFIFCLQLVPAKAQWVTIPDVNFVNKLTQLFPSCMNGNQMDTTCSQIVNLPSIDLSSLYITDIEGIQYFDNLLVLNCEDNQLTSLPNLPSTLWELYCGYNQLTNISNLPNELIILDCPNNQITNIDNFPNTLLGLFCGFNQLSGLPQVPNVMEYFGINNTGDALTF